ncbi:hypothetical protein [Maribacter ulvicola]|uniref:Uncharacterized protein n=1 Tax=Maribacter ulvicola TaxID=228959 RepID=A0A1N7AHN1_9FLAO|nr:hypothetical protein [Maribacter ulvicola]SIR38549.1 hypothetical protein SAMN05421797_11221 [Maribacter ulvicola]
MKALFFFILFITLAIPSVFGQIKIGDNPQNINASSVLELESTSKVLVITRVTSLEMEAIVPHRGGMVYNIDTECIHYYNGIQWINLCDAVNFTITNDPIINGRSTIELTQPATGYNLEVAKNSILGDNIIDGGIGPDDIQNNSITQDKLASASVGSDEIRENAVGSNELAQGAVTPLNMANDSPFSVLTTNENGNVQWEDSNDLYDLTFNKLDTTLTISRSTTAGTSSISLGALIGSDDQQLDLTGNILSIENDPNTYDLSTYLQTLSINNRTISLTNGGSVELPAGTVNTDNQSLALTGNTLAITGGNSVNLNKYLDNTDEQQLSIVGNRISLTDGGFVDIPKTNLDEGYIFIGNADSDPEQFEVSGDLTMNNIGEFRLANNIIDSLNIINSAISLQNINKSGATNGQVIKWDETLNAGQGAWTVANDTGANITDSDINDGLSNHSSTLGYNIIVDNNTIEIEDDALQVKENAIGLDQLNAMGADTDGQILKWNQTSLTWELGTDIGGTLPDGQVLVGNATGDATPLTLYGDATIANTGELFIAANAVENTMIAANVAGNGLAKSTITGALDIIPGTTDNQILKWNNTTLIWELGTDNGGVPDSAAGTILFSDGSNSINVNETELFWDNTNNRLGIGTITPDRVLDVDGETKSTSFTSSEGSVGQPAYGFYTNDDYDTGMYRIAADEIGFSVGGNLALTIDEPRTGITNVTINGSFSTNIRTDNNNGNILVAENDYTLIISNATSVVLPAPSTTGLGLNIGKIYILKNTSGAPISISQFSDSEGDNSVLFPPGILKLQSDGSLWHQIN